MLFQLICAFSLVHKFFLIHIGKILKKITIKSYIGTSVEVVVVAAGDMTSPKKNVFLPFFSNFNPLVEVRKKMQSSSLKKSWYCFIAWLPT